MDKSPRSKIKTIIKEPDLIQTEGAIYRPTLLLFLVSTAVILIFLLIGYSILKSKINIISNELSNIKDVKPTSLLSEKDVMNILENELSRIKKILLDSLIRNQENIGRKQLYEIIRNTIDQEFNEKVLMGRGYYFRFYEEDLDRIKYQIDSLNHQLYRLRKLPSLSFGKWRIMDINKEYVADSDGFVIAYLNAKKVGSVGKISGITISSLDSNRYEFIANVDYAQNKKDIELITANSIFMPVRSKDIWTVRLLMRQGEINVQVFWMPLIFSFY